MSELVEPLKPPERVDLFQYLKNLDEIGEYHKYCHIDTLKAFLSNDIKLLSSFYEDKWQGECFALLELPNRNYFIWKDSFGSCSGCDALMGSKKKDAYEYIKSTLSEGNTLQFKTVKDVIIYLEQENPRECWPWGAPSEFIDDLKLLIEV